MQTGNTDFIYKSELDKACFRHDMAYDKSNDLGKRTQVDKVLGDKIFKIANDPKHDGYQKGLASMVYKFFDKKSSGSALLLPNQIISLQLNFIGRLLENATDEKFIYHLETIFGVLI